MKKLCGLLVLALTCSLSGALFATVIVPTMNAWNHWEALDTVSANGKTSLANRLDQIDSMGYDVCFVFPVTRITPEAAGPGLPIGLTQSLTFAIIGKRRGEPGFQCGGSVPGGSQPSPPSPPTVPMTCTTPDPFVVFGGGTCVNGEWLPPGL